MEFRLDGKVAVVTGATGGIGQVICAALTGAGATVVGVDTRSAPWPLNESGKSVPYVDWVLCDVSDPLQVDKVWSQICGNMGRVDILVPAAGIASAIELPDVSAEELDRVLAVNVKGTFFFVQAAFRTMKAQGSGKIICLGSSAGKMGGLVTGPHYAMSKGAVHALVHAVGRAGAPYGVYCNGVAPGPVQTSMLGEMLAARGLTGRAIQAGIPLGRLGHPEDVAGAILFLASSASDWVTGVVLDVNGGTYMG